ncbi:MAG: prepilin peptidase [Francisellaceae bacterium]|nr:prepilin peptidase [Francisellaceae bacterium]
MFLFTIIILSWLVGSFLNVIIYRLPLMLEKEFQKDCNEIIGKDYFPINQTTFNLCLPRSRCSQCQKMIFIRDNIPLLSYLLLKGKCRHCKSPISLRYPMIEALTLLLSTLVAIHFGQSVQTLFGLLLTWSLIVLFFIDLDHFILPDNITLSLLWVGLLGNASFNLFQNLNDALWGAVFGYLSLWGVYQGYKLLTNKEGMGYGDFKLLALFGAWFGWQSLPFIILSSSLLGSIIGISYLCMSGKSSQTPIPFGPFLSIAGFIYLLWDKTIQFYYIKWAGLI